MLSLCRDFHILPSFVPKLLGEPGFCLHLLSNNKEGKGVAVNRCPLGELSSTANNNLPYMWSDFTYSVPLPWLSTRLPESSLKTPITSYTKFEADGVPKFTLFCNLPSALSEAIKYQWELSVHAFANGMPYGLHPHLTLFGMALEELQPNIKFLDSFFVSHVSMNQKHFEKPLTL